MVRTTRPSPVQANAALDGLSAAVAGTGESAGEAAPLTSGTGLDSGITDSQAVASEGPGPGAGELGGAPSNSASEGIDAAGGGSGSGVASGSLPVSSGPAGGGDSSVDPGALS